MRLLALHMQFDFAAFRRKLDRVGQQIPNDLL
jgi:hypothetical protein